jgi:uncharacterized protein (DUF58 family)
MGFGGTGKFDLGRQLAAILGFVTLSRFDRVSVVPLGGQGGSGALLQGKHRLGDLLATLDACQPAGSLDLNAELRAFAARGVRGEAVLISDFLFAQGYSEGLTALTTAGLNPAVLHVLADEELRPEPGGDVQMEDLETGELVLVGLSSQAVATYQARLAAWNQELRRFCEARRLRYLQVGSSDSVERLALVSLRQAGILQ